MSKLANILHGTPLTPDEALAEKLAEMAEQSATIKAATNRKSSGVSTHRRSSLPQKSEAQVEGDLYGLSLDELRRRANAQLRGE